MRLTSWITVLALGTAAAGCSYNKQCFGDGVCKVTKDGVTTYEGPPDKVAKYQHKDEEAKAKSAALDKAYADAPKRDGSEPIRVVVIANTSASNVAPLMAAYQKMLEQALAQDARLQVVPGNSVALYLQATTGDGMEKSRLGDTPKIDEKLARVLRDVSGAVDVAIVLHADEKSRSGLVSGGGGTGVAEVVNLEFQASLSSVYAFAADAQSKVGDSTAGVSLSGIDKTGKAQQGELKGKRDPERDRAAITGLATWLGQTIESKIAPGLPATAAAKQIHDEHAGEMLGQR